jgi:hypothetical protein
MSTGQLPLPILGSRNPAKRRSGGIKWGVAPLDTPNDPPPVGDNRSDAIAPDMSRLSLGVIDDSQGLGGLIAS